MGIAFSFKKPVYILPFIALSLIFGIITGWFRIGWEFSSAASWPEHGAIMTGGFVGTLICLERTISFKYKAALIIPIISSLSIVFFLLKYNDIAYWMLLTASLGLCVVYFIIYFEHSELYILIMTAGAFTWLIGNIFLIQTHFYPNAVMWWIAFLFFTILGERLELSRYLMIKFWQKILLIIFLALYVTGILMPFHGSGGYLTAISLIGSGLWLYKYDMAKKSLIKEGQHFYSGIVLLAGYAWLIITGVLMAWGAYSGLFYDAVLHSFFLGFAFSMIFAHAPIILPGILKLQINIFNRSLYLWFILLQLSLIMRIASVLDPVIFSKQIGGLLNGVAISGFIINILFLLLRGKLSIRNKVLAKA
ncbi:MAG: hypothetical protein EHM58_00020 [Ignavibacteriae bacterium]|nr:MAG: hypothetical protein EHM58_00020 [Ignavibacteriota bacterium]